MKLFQESNDGLTWVAYPFRYKPQDVMQPPLIYAPYQPRFDWNLWFASLGSWSQYPIVSRTEELLLTNDPDVLQLFASNPFGDKPPKMVRAVIWQHWFSTMREKRTQGIWWQHRLLGTYAPTLAVGPNGTIDIVAEPACLRLGTDLTSNTAALSSRKNENPAIVQIHMPRPLNDRHTRNVQHKKACVIGAGPNGLAAAIVLAQTGLEVEVFEAESLPGGAARTMELTLPGFLHDFASAVHPMTVGSPFFSTLPLHDCGLEWIHSPALLAHPMDDGTAVLLERNFDDAQSALGGDGAAWRDLMEPLVERRAELARDIMRPPLSWPRHPFLLARFAIHAIPSAGFVARHRFRTERVRALFADLSAHSFLSLDQALSASFGIVMGASAHAVGWPIPRGGAQFITNALSGYLEALGGRIRTSTCIDNFQQLSRCDLTLCDVTRINCYVYQARSFRQALSKSTEAVSLWPWRLQSGLRAGKSDSMDGGGVPPGQPLCMWEEARRRLLLPKPRYRRKDFRAAIRSGCAANVVDTSRAPDGKHIAWAYCHVPNSSRVNCLESLENQIERFAPGFRDCVLARRVFAPADLESMDANLVGGDIGGGAVDVRQFLFRPTWRQYRTSASDVYFCSSSSPPGGGAWHVWIQRGPGGAASFKQLVRRLCDVS